MGTIICAAKRITVVFLIIMMNSNVAACKVRTDRKPERGVKTVQASPYTVKDLKSGIVAASEQYYQLFFEAKIIDAATTLRAEIDNIKKMGTMTPQIPEYGVGFFPKITEYDANPYIAALHKTAEQFIKADTGCYPLSQAGKTIFPAANSNDSRNVGRDMEQLFFLVTSPLSRYQFHSKLVAQLFCRIYATSYDYHLNGGRDLGIPGSTPDALDDWFATGPMIYSWRMVDAAYGPLIPNTFRKFMVESAKRAGDAVGGIQTLPRYANRDISYSEILLNAGLYLKNEAYIEKSNLLLKQTVESIYPDGAFPYIWNQNECVNYHGANIKAMSRIYAMTGNKMAYQGILQLKNFEVLSVEPGNIGEFYTAPAWKTMWNGVSGIDNAEPVASSTHNNYLRTMIDQYNAQKGANPSALAASFYDRSLAGKPLPDGYIVYDRNIEGPRGRYGYFSFGITGRKVQSNGNQDPGQQTLAGAMITEDAGQGRQIDSILMAVYPKVHVQPTKTAGTEWDSWAYLRSSVLSATSVAKNSAAYGATMQLQTQTVGPAAKVHPWRSLELWITLPDRIVGAVEVSPIQSAMASAVDGRIKLGYGRTGVNLAPSQLSTIAKGKEYRYGLMRVLIHENNFKRIDTAAAGVIRDEYPVASEVRL
ncbi:MAG: hypothetical protein HQK54_13215, partial [Oligoflexales bacterium]|nr:hypothetical protein [Oligoflexales bacterium]